jgi:hypothetical protein
VPWKRCARARTSCVNSLGKGVKVDFRFHQTNMQHQYQNVFCILLQYQVRILLQYQVQPGTVYAITFGSGKQSVRDATRLDTIGKGCEGGFSISSRQIWSTSTKMYFAPVPGIIVIGLSAENDFFRFESRNTYQLALSFSNLGSDLQKSDLLQHKCP